MAEPRLIRKETLQKVRRARRRRLRKEGWWKRPAAIALAVGLLFAGLAALTVRPGLIIPLPNAAYGSSLARNVASWGGICPGRLDDGRLRCLVVTDNGSGFGGVFFLRQTSRGCWKAKWASRAEVGPASGCVRAWDLLLPKDGGGVLY